MRKREAWLRWKESEAHERQIGDLRTRFQTEMRQVARARKVLDDKIAACKAKRPAVEDDAYSNQLAMLGEQRETLSHEEFSKRDAFARDYEDLLKNRIVYTEAEKPFVRGFLAELARDELRPRPPPRAAFLNQRREERETLADMSAFFRERAHAKLSELGAKEMDDLRRFYKFCDVNETGLVEDSDVEKSVRRWFSDHGGATAEEVDGLLLRSGVDSHERLCLTLDGLFELFKKLVPAFQTLILEREGGKADERRFQVERCRSTRDQFEYEFSLKLDDLQHKVQDHTPRSFDDQDELERRIQRLKEERKAERISWSRTAVFPTVRESQASWTRDSTASTRRSSPSPTRRSSPPRAASAAKTGVDAKAGLPAESEGSKRRPSPTRGKARKTNERFPREVFASTQEMQRAEFAFRVAAAEAIARGPWEGTVDTLNDSTIAELKEFYQLFATGTAPQGQPASDQGTSSATSEAKVMTSADIREIVRISTGQAVSEEEFQEFISRCCAKIVPPARLPLLTCDFVTFVALGPSLYARIADAQYFRRFPREEQIAIVEEKQRLHCPLASYEVPVARYAEALRKAATDAKEKRAKSPRRKNVGGREPVAVENGPLLLLDRPSPHTPSVVVTPRQPQQPPAASSARRLASPSTRMMRVKLPTVLEARRRADDSLLSALRASLYGVANPRVS